MGNMYCRLNHTLSSAYSVRRGYTISIPITNHNQLCYINSKKIFKGQKNKVPKSAGRWYTAFLPGFTGTDLSCPPLCRKKIETSCLYLIVTLLQNTRTIPSKVMKGVLWRYGNFTLHTIGRGIMQFFMSLVPYWVSQQNASIFFLIQSISFK